jgi:hypothetical protein
MSTNIILRKAWKMLCNYRALWLFGTALALAGVGAIYTVPWSSGQQENDQWIQIKLTEYFTLQVPGSDVTIDLTDPKSIRISAPEGSMWHEIQNQFEHPERLATINIQLILIEFGVILAGSILLGLAARYVAETALFCMVDETTQNDKRLNIWEGLRRGWSPGAGRLFLFDLTVRILIGVIFAWVFGLSIAPLLLALRSRDWVIITLGVGTVSLLIFLVYLWFAVHMILGLVLQPIRRACVLEKQSLAASIREGFRMMKGYPKELGLIGLIWLGIRLCWVPLAGLILLLLLPLLLMTTLLGVGVGGVPGILVTGIASLFTDGLTAWIMGLIAGFPTFLVIMLSPMLFINGLLEVYLSSIWTLAYRDLRAVQPVVEKPGLQARALSTAVSTD